MQYAILYCYKPIFGACRSGAAGRHIKNTGIWRITTESPGLRRESRSNEKCANVACHTAFQQSEGTNEYPSSSSMPIPKYVLNVFRWLDVHWDN